MYHYTPTITLPNVLKQALLLLDPIYIVCAFLWVLIYIVTISDCLPYLLSSSYHISYVLSNHHGVQKLKGTHQFFIGRMRFTYKAIHGYMDSKRFPPLSMFIQIIARGLCTVNTAVL